MVDEKTLKKSLKERLTPERYKHTLGVTEVACELALKEGMLVPKARIAGLLHDYAKNFKDQKLIKLAREAVKQGGYDIDKYEWQLPVLLHAPVGAYLARGDFAITDQEILEAIRYHTVGKPGMGKLAQIIFIADFVEPNRHFPGVNEVRKLVEQGLKQALIAICNSTISYNIKRNRIIHPNTLLLRNKLLGG